MKTLDQALQIISRGAVQVTPREDLIKKLKTKPTLTVKLGMDPTSPDLHLGHAVVLMKMKELQDLGHKIVLIIGDFTARIGDPTGRSKTRPPLSLEEIKHNATTYFNQVSRILDPKKVTIRYNSEWLDALSPQDFIKLCASTTLARLTEREDFAQRIADRQPIYFHELLYPLMQGYDSIALHADIELGGTDQTFNLLMGRFLQEQYGAEPQVIITMPLLEGLDGVAKMSKSLGNAIGLTEPADQAYGKLMSLSDTMMWRYAELLLGKEPTEIAKLKEEVVSGSLHPMNCKKSIAHAIISRFWSVKEADAAQAQFEALFQKKDYSQAQLVELPVDTANPLWIVDLLKLIGALETSSEARRLIDAGALEIDGAPVKDFKAEIRWTKGMTIKAGKHKIYRIG